MGRSWVLFHVVGLSIVVLWGRAITRWGYRCMIVRGVLNARDVPAYLIFNQSAWLVVIGRLKVEFPIPLFTVAAGFVLSRQV